LPLPVLAVILTLSEVKGKDPEAVDFSLNRANLSSDYALHLPSIAQPESPFEAGITALVFPTTLMA